MSHPCPKISILLPVYGAERFIERCAVSLFEQTYTNLEYVFVNDCTRDRSMEVLQTVARRYPERQAQLHIVNHDVNRGVGAARNTLLDAATGEFVLFIDPDDYVDTNLVEQLVQTQTTSDADVVVYDYQIIRNSGCETCAALKPKSPQDYVLSLLRRDTAVGVLGKMVRLSLFNDHSIRVEGGINIEEDFLIILMAIYYARTIATCHGVNYYYDKRNENSITSRLTLSRLNDEAWFYDHIRHFFQEKEPVIIPTLHRGEVHYFLEYIKQSLALGNREAYGYVKQRILRLQKTSRVSMGLSAQFMLHAPFSAACLYVRSGRHIKSLLRKLGLMS